MKRWRSRPKQGSLPAFFSSSGDTRGVLQPRPHKKQNLRSDNLGKSLYEPWLALGPPSSPHGRGRVIGEPTYFVWSAHQSAKREDQVEENQWRAADSLDEPKNSLTSEQSFLARQCGFGGNLAMTVMGGLMFALGPFSFLKNKGSRAFDSCLSIHLGAHCDGSARDHELSKMALF